MPFTRAAAGGDGEDKFDIARVNLLMAGNADRPGKAARTQCLTERRTHAIAGISEDRSESNAGADQTIQFGKRDPRLGPRRAIFDGHAGALQPNLVVDPGLRQEQPQAFTITGTSPRASVSDTNV